MSATQPVWSSRTGSADRDATARFLAYSESIDDDAPYVVHDLAGSIAHVAGLHAAALLDTEEATALIDGLQTLHQDHVAGNFALDPALEDVHMNIEAQLAEVAGPVAAKLHTGRSRNDQVATCLTLYATQGLAAIAGSALALANALQDAAHNHLETPWVAKTHGQPAQPATLGFLLSAHASRALAVAEQAVDAYQAASVCPLGAGAIAGSTLPLEPTVPARLLGLEPLEHALVSTGTRDTVLVAVQAAAFAGTVAASLAADLLAMHTEGLYAPPKAYTSGSSLMPQKRNPDALELARGHGKALAGHQSQVHDIVGGLGLGYHRDFQLTKPILVDALTRATQTLAILRAHVTHGTFDQQALNASLDVPGITATDAAEALVSAGHPFRAAYHAVAAAMADHLESGTPLPAALAATALGEQDPAAAANAAECATVADASRRKTRGGPAPIAVEATLARLAMQTQMLASLVDAATTLAAKPASLLTTPASTILDQDPFSTATITTVDGPAPRPPTHAQVNA